MNGFANMGPCVIGAVGGSGTRVVARALHELGVFLGHDLNEPYDNLTATFLLNRRQAILEPKDIDQALDILSMHMTTSDPLDPGQLLFIDRIAAEDRQQHSRSFLLSRRAKLLEDRGPRPDGPWGWKMPPNHLFLNHILNRNKQAKYLHIERHPLDMAFSSNRNQLKMWGPIVLGRDTYDSPADALSYWCKVNERVRNLKCMFPERILIVSFEELCSLPADGLRRIGDFFDISMTQEHLAFLSTDIVVPETIGRYKKQDISVFRQADIHYIENVLGYSILH